MMSTIIKLPQTITQFVKDVKAQILSTKSQSKAKEQLDKATRKEIKTFFIANPGKVPSAEQEKKWSDVLHGSYMYKSFLFKLFNSTANPHLLKYLASKDDDFLNTIGWNMDGHSGKLKDSKAISLVEQYIVNMSKTDLQTKLLEMNDLRVGGTGARSRVGSLVGQRIDAREIADFLFMQRDKLGSNSREYSYITEILIGIIKTINMPLLSLQSALEALMKDDKYKARDALVAYLFNPIVKADKAKVLRYEEQIKADSQISAEMMSDTKLRSIALSLIIDQKQDKDLRISLLKSLLDRSRYVIDKDHRTSYMKNILTNVEDFKDLMNYSFSKEKEPDSVRNQFASGLIESLNQYGDVKGPKQLALITEWATDSASTENLRDNSRFLIESAKSTIRSLYSRNKDWNNNDEIKAFESALAV